MKKNKRILVCIGIIVGLVFVFFISRQLLKNLQINNQAEEKIILKLAEVHALDYPTSIANQKFADLVEDRTEGRIQIDIYSGGILGEETDVIEAMKKGNIDFGRVSVGPLAEYVDQLYVLMLPYLYEDAEHMWRVLDSVLGTQILESLEEAGLTGLAWYDSGARSFYLTEHIADEKGFIGRKIRVQKSSLMYAMCEALGALPLSLPESEIYIAGLEGSIDGAENNIPTYETYKQYEVYPYYIMDEHIRIPDLLTVSDITLKKLSKEDQEIIKNAAIEAGKYQRVLWHKREQAAMDRLKEKGVQFITLSEEAKDNLKAACQSLYDAFAGKYQELIEEIEEMAKE